MLLELAARMADGRFELGGRHILIRRGEAVGVTAMADDPHVEDLLVQTSRMTPDQAERIRRARVRGEDTSKLLASAVSSSTLHKARRALWTGRLVKSLAASEKTPGTVGHFVPSAPHWEAGSQVHLVSLLLDSLARRAAAGDADLIGKSSTHLFRWEDSPHLELACRWSGLEDLPDPPAVDRLLARYPSGAPRMAALIRAGLARLVSPTGDFAPPPERPKTFPPSAPPPQQHLQSTRPERSYGPGAVADDLEVRASIPFPVMPTGTLDDPLEPLENKITQLEQIRAPSRDRAAAWKEVAHAWNRHFHALGEAARAFREASAADPSDIDAALHAARSCMQLAQLKLARAYARTASQHAPSDEKKEEALQLLVALALRDGRPGEASEADRELLHLRQRRNRSSKPAKPDRATINNAIMTATRTNNPNDIVEALTRAAQYPGTASIEIARTAFDALARQNAYPWALARQFAIDCAHIDPSLLRELTRRIGDAPLKEQVLTLEHLLARADPADQPKYLSKIAELFRADRSAAGEARTLLRLLSVAPYHRMSLERLRTIFSETGENDRLMAILALQLEAATDASERAKHLRELASTAYVTDGNSDRALGFVRYIFDEAGEDEERLLIGIRTLLALERPRRAARHLVEAAKGRDSRGANALLKHAVAVAEKDAGDTELALEIASNALKERPTDGHLLMSFERLSLEGLDIRASQTVYEILQEHALGENARRALHYRQGRWLEQAGETEQALKAYAKAFALWPSAGVVFDRIESLAMKLGAFGELADACTTLADHSTDITRQRELWRHAGQLSLRNKQTRRAFGLFLRSWRETGDVESRKRAEQLARELLIESPSTGSEAYSMLIEAIEQQAKSSNDLNHRVALYAEAARICAIDCRNQELAIEYTEKAAQQAGADPHLAQRRADLYARAASWLLEIFGRRKDAKTYIDKALDIWGGHRHAQSLLYRLGDVQSDPPGARSSLLPISFVPDARYEDPAREEIERFRSRIAAGDIQAGVDLAELLASHGRQKEAHRLLLSVVRQDPARVGTLRKLVAMSSTVQAPAIQSAAEEVLAIFDMSYQAGKADTRYKHEDARTPYDPELAAAQTILELIWEHSRGQFRVERADLGIAGTDRITPSGISPLAAAYADALKALDLTAEVELYRRNASSGQLRVAATTPPSVIVEVVPGDDTLEDPDALRFRIARAVELARPSNILLTSRPEDEAKRLLRAIRAAFSKPAHSRSTSELDADAIELGRGLWDRLPAHAQATVTAELAKNPDALRFDELMPALLGRAACVGLAVCGRLTASVRGLCADDPALAGKTIATEKEYIDACHASHAFRAMVRFALSDDRILARLRNQL